MYDEILSFYPMTDLAYEVDNDVLLEFDFADLKTIEPWWKLILESKAMLPFLWHNFPNHPSTLPAYFADPYSEMG